MAEGVPLEQPDEWLPPGSEPLTVVDKTKAEPDKPKVAIEVVDDTPVEDKDRPKRDPKTAAQDVSDEELKSYSDNVQKRIKQLRYEYHEERRAKESAARQQEEAIGYARKVLEENNRLKAMLQGKDIEAVGHARRAIQAELERAQQKLAIATEQGKPDDIASAQVALSTAAAQRALLPPEQPQQQQLSPQQIWQLQQAQQPQYQPQQIPQQFYQQVPQASTPDPQAVKWLKSNPWFGDDEEMTGYAYGVHERLVKKESIDPRTEDYYEKIDAAMRHRFPEKFEEEEPRVPPRPAPSSRSSVVAAPSRGTAPRKVQLTTSQAALAKRLGITLEQYAEQLLKEQANG